MFGYQPDRPVLRNLSFGIIGPERIAIPDPTVQRRLRYLALVAGRLKPWTGTVQAMTKLSALDQSVDLLDGDLDPGQFSAAQPRSQRKCLPSRACPLYVPSGRGASDRTDVERWRKTARWLGLRSWPSNAADALGFG